ncbi:MAG: GNAT family N-acetyltransferase [Steroidobacteraceae bacterium]
MIAIRHAEPSDIPSLVKLMQELGYPTDAERLREKLASFDASVMDALLVAEKEGNVVACLGLHAMEILPSGRLGRITAIVVASDARRQGIGKRLMDAGVQYFDSQECTILEVTSSEHRQEAHALFRSFGFAEKRSRFIRKLA